MQVSVDRTAILQAAQPTSRTPPPHAAGSQPELTYACWLSPDVLVIILDVASPQADEVEAYVERGGARTSLPVAVLAYGSFRAEPGRRTRLLLVLRLPDDCTAGDASALVLRLAGQELHTGQAELRAASVTLKSLLRREFAPLSAQQRAGVLDCLLVGAGPGMQEASVRAGDHSVRPAVESQVRAVHRPVQLATSLNSARQALRERMPAGVISVAVPQGLSIDAVYVVDECSFYAQGWLRDEQAPAVRLTAVSPEGCRTELLPGLYRFRRHDVEQFYGDSPDEVGIREFGWIAYFHMPVASFLNSGWVFEMSNAAGVELEVQAPAVVRDASTVRERILHDLTRERLPADRLRRDHISPALTRLEERRRSLAVVTHVEQFGAPPLNPTVTVVVPLYGRVDFLEQQLAQFVHDPELKRADIVYVLDSPELAEPFRVSAAHLAELYAVPFRAVVLSHNVGFSGVNNIGAELARGRLLLLLNSDVLPSEPGWLGAMTAFYDSTPGIGALAPKLLYEDDSIQHAGLYFRQLADSRLWNNEHYYKGLARTLPAANVAREVPAVTAACMMIDLALYRDLGGLRGMYIQGDYEDSDLCLRMSKAGLQNWYLPGVELYHLEGQSYPSQMRDLTSAYNRWLHAHTWRSEFVLARGCTR
jgi:GT2 family glycosyltransferase